LSLDESIVKWEEAKVCINRCRSERRDVTSGVPRGSVLGPVLFLIFINDLESTLLNSVLKFADDTKLFGKVNNDIDRSSFQKDLHRLIDWSEQWQMPFNITKRTVCRHGLLIIRRTNMF